MIRLSRYNSLASFSVTQEIYVDVYLGRHFLGVHARSEINGHTKVFAETKQMNGHLDDCSESSLPLLSSFIYFLFIYLTHCTVTLLQGLWCSFGHIMVNKQASFLCVCVWFPLFLCFLIFILLFYLLSSLSTTLFPLTIFIFFISSTSISVFLYHLE